MPLNFLQVLRPQFQAINSKQENIFYTCPEPLGLHAGTSAWNDPLQIACWKAAPSLCFSLWAKPAFPLW
jgi:betaine-aldehyde dehydrogenase